MPEDWPTPDGRQASADGPKRFFVKINFLMPESFNESAASKGIE